MINGGGERRGQVKERGRNENREAKERGEK